MPAPPATCLIATSVEQRVSWRMAWGGVKQLWVGGGGGEMEGVANEGEMGVATEGRNGSGY